MIVLKILGWILLGGLGLALVLMLLLCCVKLSVRIGYAQTPLVECKIAFFRFRLTDEKKPKRAKKGKRKQPGKQKPAAKKQKKPKPAKEAPPVEHPPKLTEVISSFKDVLTGVFTQLRKQLKLEELRVRILVATEDASKTALAYGAVCAALQPLQCLALGLPRVNKKRVHVQAECDFLAEAYEADIEACISTRVWRLALVGLHSMLPLIKAFRLLKAYTNGKGQKERDDQHGIDDQAMAGGNHPQHQQNG